MLPDFNTLVEKIKSDRKELGWSQRTLADRVIESLGESSDIKMSRSLVGKVERGEHVPNYKSMKAIYDTVNKENKPPEEQAKEFQTKNIKTVNPRDKVKKARSIMKENDFSQLPVKDDFEYKGLVLSRDIMDVNGKKQIQDVKTHPLPRIPDSTSKKSFKELLKTHNAVLVEKDNEVTGMITSADLL